MSSLTPCPNCRRQLQIPPELSGKRIKCPSCSTSFTPSHAVTISEPAIPEVVAADPIAELDRVQARIDHAWRRVQTPGLFLMIVGMLNTLNGMLWLASGMQMLRQPDQHVAQLKELLEKIGLDDQAKDDAALEEQVKMYGFIYVIAGPIGAMIGLFTVYGAMRMRSLRSLRLARAVSILAMLPFASPCCIMGFPFGLWSLLVLGRWEIASQFE